MDFNSILNLVLEFEEARILRHVPRHPAVVWHASYNSSDKLVTRIPYNAFRLVTFLSFTFA